MDPTIGRNSYEKKLIINIFLSRFFRITQVSRDLPLPSLASSAVRLPFIRRTNLLTQYPSVFCSCGFSIREFISILFQFNISSSSVSQIKNCGLSICLVRHELRTDLVLATKTRSKTQNSRRLDLFDLSSKVKKFSLTI